IRCLTTSPMLTMARSLPSTTTGTWRTRRSVICRASSSRWSSGLAVCTSAVMIADTGPERTSAPERCRWRTTSRSLTMPATVWPSSLTTSAPIPRSSRTARRCSTVSSGGTVSWRTSPGGLVTAMESVMRGRDGAWVGWAGEPGDPPEPFHEDGMFLQPVGLSAHEVREYYEGFSNDTLWPIYHDVIVPAKFHRAWWNCYRSVNRRFAESVAEVAAPGATVWVHDYQLQLVPAMVRELRPDVRIGWFNHIPFPPVELFAQLPWRRALVEGLLGADFLGFQRTSDAENFLRACRRLLGLTTRADTVTVGPTQDGGEGRQVRASAIPISV